MGSIPIKMGVAYIPYECFEEKPTIYIVVDVIRATSTIVTLFEQGCEQVFLTDDVKKVHAYHKTAKEKMLICAEDAVGRRLEGADFSPSLTGIKKEDGVRGKQVVIQTTNGTAAAHRLAENGAQDIYIGSMLNSEAVMNAALDEASVKGLDITIVCAGRNAGKWITLDDVYCAARLLEHAFSFSEKNSIPIVLLDSAKIALSQLQEYANAEDALTASASAENLRKIGSTEDIAQCAQESVSNLAPKIFKQHEYPFIEIRRN